MENTEPKPATEVLLEYLVAKMFDERKSANDAEERGDQRWEDSARARAGAYEDAYNEAKALFNLRKGETI